MPDANAQFIVGKLDALRAELVDLAFELECRGRLDAADIAVATSARVSEIREELVASNLPGDK